MTALTHLENNCENIDASVFSGDLLFDDARRTMLKDYITRWSNAIKNHESRELEDDGEAMTKETESELPQNCGTGYCSCIECLRDAIDDDEPSCARCGGPMYTQPHWGYAQCDDCGRREDKEVDEP